MTPPGITPTINIPSSPGEATGETLIPHKKKKSDTQNHSYFPKLKGNNGKARGRSIYAETKANRESHDPSLRNDAEPRCLGLMSRDLASKTSARLVDYITWSNVFVLLSYPLVEEYC